MDHSMKTSPSFKLHSPSIESIRLRRIFDAFDDNKDGKISVHELDHALQKLGLPIAHTDLESTVEPFFNAQNGGLEFEDFVQIHTCLGFQLFGEEVDSCGDEEDLMEAFRVFDEDRDGFISAGELQWVLGRLGFAEGEKIENCERMICGVDENRDGRVDFLEFKHMMRNIIAA
eukprot:Gb_13868 [translate_table: standard]